MDEEQIDRLEPYVRVLKNDTSRNVICDTLIVNRLSDGIPKNFKAKQTFQMCHTCNNTMKLPLNRDRTVFVSNSAKVSFNDKNPNNVVIRNLLAPVEFKESLLLVSATRLDTNDKGQARMLKLARELNYRRIPYVWLYFSNVELMNAPKNMVCMPTTLDIRNYIAMADYLVQLSSSESFCYSIVESLTCGVPVICTDLPILSEIGVKDGENAHVLPLDINADYPVDKIYSKRLKNTFKYAYDNSSIIKEWKAILGNTKPLGNYIPNVIRKVRVHVDVKYFDMVLQMQLYPNDELLMKEDRAYYLQNEKKFLTVVG
jgi:hypothetical protein